MVARRTVDFVSVRTLEQTPTSAVIAAGGGRQQITHDSGLNFTGGWIDSSTVLVLRGATPSGTSSA